MRVCLIAPVPPFRGGIAKYCHSLARELEKRHALLLLSYRRQYPAVLYGSKSQIDPDCDSRQIIREFKSLSYDIDSTSISSWFATSQKIAAFAPDLVILPWWVAYWAPMYTYLLSALKRRGIKTVILGINIFEHEDNALKKIAAKFILRKADYIVVHSGPEKKLALEINPGAVVKKHLLPLFEYAAQSAAKHHDRLQLLFFGFVRPYKGLDTLVRAVGILKDQDISLMIAGEFWSDKGEIVKLIDEYGISEKVTIIDRYVPDQEMSGYFGSADLVVLPYRQSQTSGIIATAYGFGKPVLATDIGGFHEVIREGLTGRTVPPDDPQALAEGILWFISNRRIDFAENIRTFAAQEMSWGSLTDMIEGFGEDEAKSMRDEG